MVLGGAALPCDLAAKMPSDVDVQKMVKARQLAEDDPEKAYEIVREVKSLPNAEDVRYHLLAELALKTQRADEARTWLVKELDETTGDSDRFKIRLELAELLAFKGDVKEAKKLASQLASDEGRLKLRSADRRFLKSRLLRLRHDLALGSDEKKRAVGFAKQLLITYPGEHSTLREGLAATRDDLSTRQKYRRGLNAMNAWGYHLAREEFTELVKLSKYEEVSKWNLGLISLRKLRDDPVGAEKLFKELSAPGGKYAEQSLYYVARSQMRQERYDDALKTMETYATRYPNGKNMMNVRYYRGWLFYDHRKNKQAIKGFDAYIDYYGRRSHKSSYIYGFRAWAYMRLQDWKAAIKAWESMMPFGNPLVEGKARYWQAYAYVKLGQKDKALKNLDTLRKRWPITYYGMLGEQLRAQIEGKSAKASEVWWPEGGGQVEDEPTIDVANYRFKGLSAADQKRWRRVKTLALVGEKHIARSELKPLYDTLLRKIPNDQEDAWVYSLGRFVGDYNKMWRRVSGGSISGRPGMIPNTGIRAAMLYPRAYRDIVGEMASEFGIPPEFVWSIMRQESRYKPGAVSYTDAVGALQMIPKTAKKVAKDLGIVFNVATFFRPEVGFRYSAYYMRKLLDTFGGLFVPTAGAYNSGPQVIAKWFRKNPDAEFAWLIEEFEYNEGRAYSRKVNEHFLRYLYLYEKDDAVRKATLDKIFPLSRDIEIPEDVGY